MNPHCVNHNRHLKPARLPIPRSLRVCQFRHSCRTNVSISPSARDVNKKMKNYGKIPKKS